MTDISSATIAELGQALRAGRATARGLLEQALQNRKEALGAYKLWMPDQAGRAADLADAAFSEGLDFGPLQGLPVSVKDLFGLAGTPTHAGASKPLPASWEAEGPVVAAVRNGLAVITGKTHTVEFAFGGVGSNPHWGTPRNPGAASRTGFRAAPAPGPASRCWKARRSWRSAPTRRARCAFRRASPARSASRPATDAGRFRASCRSARRSTRPVC